MAQVGDGIEVTIRSAQMRGVVTAAVVALVSAIGGAAGLRYVNPLATDAITRKDALEIARSVSEDVLAAHSAALAQVVHNEMAGVISRALEGHRDAGHHYLSAQQREQIDAMIGRSEDRVLGEMRACCRSGRASVVDATAPKSVQ